MKFDNLIVVGMRDKVPEGFTVVNTTSRDKEGYGQQLSPFYLRDVPMYDGIIAKNMENAWQFSKVYEEHVDENGDPTEAYYTWARAGWANWRAERYPMGKGRKPLYSLWDGKKLDYITARRNLYFPMYARAVVQTETFKDLWKRVNDGEKIALLDFDGYHYQELGMDYYDVIHAEDKKCGHGFVIYGLIQRELILSGDRLFLPMLG